jgi:homoserine O-acetyltransferase/O-succinyltransferase
MGGMQSWMWATMYPDFMDAAFPLASLPAQIAGRNRMMRKMAIDSIRDDPGYNAGDYVTQPRGLKAAFHILAWMSSAPLRWQQQAPDRESADVFIDDLMAKYAKLNDANDFVYAFDASRDYDPRPGLKNIKAALTAVNFADDQVNPPELGLLEAGISQVPAGQAIVVPISDATVGHGTHTVAAVWKDYLRELLERSGPGRRSKM